MDLMTLLPEYYLGNNTMEELQRILSIEANRLESNYNKTVDQFFIGTATDLLGRYEKILDLTVEPNLSIEDRRSLIKSKILLQPPASKTKMVDIIKNFAEDGEIEEIYDEYRFNVIVKTSNAIGDKLPTIHQIIEDFKPAHLNYLFIICYMFHPKAYVKFLSYLSEEAEVCGTVDVNGKKYESTMGRSYKEETIYLFDKGFSEKIHVAYETNYIQAQGCSYKNTLIYNFNSYASSILQTCSENTYAREAAN